MRACKRLLLAGSPAAALWLSNRSGGRRYVPTLAEAILHAMQNGTYTGAKLAGIAVGNGCSGSEIGVCGPEGDHYRTEFLLEHAFMSRCAQLFAP